MIKVEEKTVGKYTVSVYVDEDRMDPRENDNLGTMACFHRRYNLGDKHDLSIDEVKEIATSDKYISLPLYLYDHSGITMNTSGFSCPWDSGQVGIIFVSKENVRREYGKKLISKKLYNRVVEILRSEVKEYDDYLTGNVYGFIVSDDEEHVDSCWGFFGDSEYAMEEGLSSACFLVKRDKEEEENFRRAEINRHVLRLKAWIKNRVPMSARKPCPIVR